MLIPSALDRGRQGDFARFDQGEHFFQYEMNQFLAGELNLGH